MIRGAAPVLGWVPQALPTPGDAPAERVLDLYSHRDPVLAAVLQKGLDADRMAMGDQLDGKTMKPKGGLDNAAGMRQSAQGAARLMAADDGPRIAALAFDGWDTHVNEGGATGRLANLLGGLDGAFEEFEKGLGALEEHGGRRHHRIRPHGAHQRHGRHRPRHGHGRAARRRCSATRCFRSRLR